MGINKREMPTSTKTVKRLQDEKEYASHKGNRLTVKKQKK